MNKEPCSHSLTSNSAEHDGGALVFARGDRSFVSQFVGNGWGQDGVKQSVRLTLFVLEKFVSVLKLVSENLQVLGEFIFLKEPRPRPIIDEKSSQKTEKHK